MRDPVQIKSQTTGNDADVLCVPLLATSVSSMEPIHMDDEHTLHANEEMESMYFLQELLF